MKLLFQTILLLLLILPSCSKSSNQQSSSTLHSYHTALELVQSAKEALDGTGQLHSHGGIYLFGEGIYDLSTRMQGMQPGVVEHYPIMEKLAVDFESGKVVYESDTFANPDAREWIRYIYDDQNRMLFLDMTSGFAFWNSQPGLSLQGKRYSNMVPQLLLQEALENRTTLQYLGTDAEGNERVSFDASSYGSLTLHIHSDSHFLTGVEYIKDMPLLGDTPIRWQFKEYKAVDGIGFYPGGYSVFIKDILLKDINYKSIQAGIQNTQLFTVPDSIDIPEIPEPVSDVPEAPVSEEPARDPLQLAEDVYVFPHIRSGFHPMVIEFNEFLMIIDTPAGWYEMHQLPAMQWADGVTSSSTGRKLLKAIREKLSDKPIRYVALTHHHSDHAGGFRPFVDEGATILASELTARLVKQAVKNTFTIEPDELTGKNANLKLETVEGEWSISDGKMEVRLIDAGANPHAKGMLVVYLPKQKILYQSDLFEPIPMHLFPSKSRVPVMKWFVNWLDSSGLDVERVYAIHGSLRVTDEHLETIRELSKK